MGVGRRSGTLQRASVDHYRSRRSRCLAAIGGLWSLICPSLFCRGINRASVSHLPGFVGYSCVHLCSRAQLSLGALRSGSQHAVSWVQLSKSYASPSALVLPQAVDRALGAVPTAVKPCVKYYPRNAQSGTLYHVRRAYLRNFLSAPHFLREPAIGRFGACWRLGFGTGGLARRTGLLASLGRDAKYTACGLFTTTIYCAVCWPWVASPSGGAACATGRARDLDRRQTTGEQW